MLAAKELKQQRRAAAMTQEDLARAIGISTQQYGKIERGQDRISIGRYKLAMTVIASHSQSLHDAGAGFREAPQQPYELSSAATLSPQQAAALRAAHDAVDVLAAAMRMPSR